MKAPRFLIDENLSVFLPPVAHAAGFEAAHVVRLGLAGVTDVALIERVKREDWVLVTNNAIEFRGRYRTITLHPGIVFLLPSVGRDVQLSLFRSAVADVARDPDTVNIALDVDFGAGRRPRVRRYSLP